MSVYQTDPSRPDMLCELGFIFPLAFHCIVIHVHGCDNNYLWYSHNIECACVYMCSSSMGIVWRIGYYTSIDLESVCDLVAIVLMCMYVCLSVLYCTVCRIPYMLHMHTRQH